MNETLEQGYHDSLMDEEFADVLADLPQFDPNYVPTAEASQADAAPQNHNFNYQLNGETYTADRIKEIQKLCPYLGGMATEKALQTVAIAAGAQEHNRNNAPEAANAHMFKSEALSKTEHATHGKTVFEMSKPFEPAPAVKPDEAHTAERYMAAATNEVARHAEAAAAVAVTAQAVQEAVKPVTVKEQKEAPSKQPVAKRPEPAPAAVKQVKVLDALRAPKAPNVKDAPKAVEKPARLTRNEPIVKPRKVEVVAEAPIKEKPAVMSRELPKPVAVFEAVVAPFAASIDKDEVPVQAEPKPVTYQQLAEVLHEPLEPLMESPATVAELAGEQQLDAALVEVAEKMQRDMAGELNELVVALRDLAEVARWPSVEAMLDGATVAAPDAEVAHRLVKVMKLLGYENAEKTLLGYVRDQGYERLIEQLCELATETYVNAETKAGLQKELTHKGNGKFGFDQARENLITSIARLLSTARPAPAQADQG